MTQAPLEQLSDRISAAHQKIQAQYSDINPVVGVNRQMRSSGIPVDAFTIDCLASGKRLLLILHDHEPDVVRYQFGYRDQDPGPTFEIKPLAEVTEQALIDWIVNSVHPAD